MKKTSSSKKEILKKSVGEKKPAFPSEVVGFSGTDAEFHALLAVKLAEGPLRYGELRERFDITPLRLEFDCISRFPECYRKGSDEKGRPTIALRPDRPPLDVMLDRAPLIAWVVESGPSGIYLASLHKHTGLTSVRIEELLAQMAGIERLVRDGRVLYKAIPNAVLKLAPAKTPTDPAVLRDQLVGLCGDSKRHLSWLSLNMEPSDILTVLTEFPKDFASEDLGQGDRLIWVVSALSSQAKGSLAETTHNRAQLETQGPMLEEVFTPQQLKEMRHRPHAPGMGTRRQRQPLVES